jgi:hypothetical protein
LSSRFNCFFSRQGFYLSVLISAAVLGIIYIFLVPPWQHNDEPGKFEFAWLIANSPSPIKPGYFDQGMRREVASSMIEHGFFRDLNFSPSLITVNEPVWIGISQINEQPLYYYLAAIPLRFLRYTDITVQLYSARFISLLLYLFTVWIVLQASNELFSEEHLLSKTVPVFVAFLPGFVDLMTAVNDDVGAVAFMTLFFWASIRILKGGLNFPNIILLTVSILFCLFTKRTAWLALPLGLLVIYLGIFRAQITNAWLTTGALSILGVLVVFSWTNSSPAYYYSFNNKSIPLVIEDTKAQAGERIISLSSDSLGFHQPLGRRGTQSLKGEWATLGMWAWASEQADISFPEIRVNGTDILNAGILELQVSPKFYSYSVFIPDDASAVVVVLKPGTKKSEVDIYFDCFVLLMGDFSSSKTAPRPLDVNCSQVEWDDQLRKNYIRNASGEHVWPVLNEYISSLIDQKYNFAFVNLFGVLDTQATWNYFSETSAHIFRTFWGKFGWGEVSLVGSKPYRFFLFLTLFAMIGWIFAFQKDRPHYFYSIIILLTLAVIGQTIMTLFRSAENWYNYVYTPNARYIYPSIFPISILINLGLWSLVQKHIRSKDQTIFLLMFFFLFMIILNGWAYYSLWDYYYS